MCGAAILDFEVGGSSDFLEIWKSNFGGILACISDWEDFRGAMEYTTNIWHSAEMVVRKAGISSFGVDGDLLLFSNP